MYLIFDTETTGLPIDFGKNYKHIDNWNSARCVQLAWQLHDKAGKLIDRGNDIVKPNGFEIPPASSRIHHITNEIAHNQGLEIEKVLDKFSKVLKKTKFLIGHNIEFDINVISAEYLRKDRDTIFDNFDLIDTMKSTIDFCQLRIGKEGVIKDVSKNGQFKDLFKFRITLENNESGILYKKSDVFPSVQIGDVVSYTINNKGTIKIRKGFKAPKLEELYRVIFNEEIINAHNAESDVDATARCFFELLRQKFYTNENSPLTDECIQYFIDNNQSIIQLFINNDGSNYVQSNLIDANDKKDLNNLPKVKTSYKQGNFSHIRCHTSYSVLQSTISIKSLISKVKEYGMTSVGITDHGNLFGAFEFLSLCKDNSILPILGCEFYLVENRKIRQGGFSRDKKDQRFSQVLYAKNKRGYHNLCKISSYGYIDGLYAGFPRVDKKLIKKFKQDIIATTSGIHGQISYMFFNHGPSKAKECFLWWLDTFQDNFYIELSQNKLEEEKELNNLLLSWSVQYGVKCVPANRIYYLDQKDATAHDALLCVKNGDQIDTPKGKGHGFRFGMPNNQFYFQSKEESFDTFSSLSIDYSHLDHFLNQFQPYTLSRDILLPKFDIPIQYNNQNDYLKYLCEIGAEKKYGKISPDIQERIDFELKTIEKTGYPGYFLIVQDIINHARNMGISVGPGRGSVGGSVVAYSLDITNVDPIKYDLLFERFLNPERISMPDIDIDFDDVGRSKLIEWVVEKYGKNQVAQIITYGRMAAKSSIRDMGRVLNVPLSKVDFLAKLIPNISLNNIFSLNQKELDLMLNNEDLAKIKSLVEHINQNKEESELIKLACLNEGSIRNLGTHACGVIITPNDITNHIPVCLNTDSDLLITQFDNSVVEKAGMLKMDFLGLNTLSQIKDAVSLIKKRHNVDLEIDNIDLSDSKTFELYQEGSTTGTFQFESAGMQKHLRSLKPDNFEDLIAMNALYRPGPMEYIPNFIARKHGLEEINYDLPIMEKYLGNTYGITVYQEQVMKLSQELAGFSQGKADILRKAMGKKKKNILDSLKEEFFQGCKVRNHDLEKIEKIWKDWEAFASYAFNKSHSTCYSYISFQTAYLKAHYPEEFMASLLTHHMNDLSKLSKYMDECKRMGICVLGPDLNESWIDYSVNDENDVRFGLGAIKGVGSIAAKSIIKERSQNGYYKNFIDFIKRIDSKVVNKRVLEALALGGVFDKITNCNRANFFKLNNDQSFIELAIQFRTQFVKKNEYRNQLEMFDQNTLSDITEEPVLSNSEKWDKLEKLNKEKLVLGIYASGHPLDDFDLEVKHFCTHQIKDIDLFKNIIKQFSFAGYVQSFEERISKSNKPYGILFLEDYSGTREFRLFGDEYIKFRNYFIENALLYISASYVKRKWDNKLTLKINEIHLLSTVSQKIIKEINFNISCSRIDDNLIENISNTIKKHPGKHKFKITIIDNGLKLDFLSKKFLVNISNNFIKDMQSFSQEYYLK